MDLDLLFKIALTIVAVGISYKIIKAVAGVAFKVALLFVIILFVIRMFM